MSYRAQSATIRLDVLSHETDPKLIGDIPDDWDDPNKFYVLRPIADPDDLTQPATQWVDLMPLLLALSGGTGVGGYGVYGTY